MLFNAIDPEIAAGQADYERNHRLLEHAKTATLLALLGPPGLLGIACLRDRTGGTGNRYREVLDSLRTWQRLVYEVLVFVIVSMGAFKAVVLKGELSIRYEAAQRGVAVAQIVAGLLRRRGTRRRRAVTLSQISHPPADPALSCGQNYQGEREAPKSAPPAVNR